MTTFNKSITIEEATKLLNSKEGMCFPDTLHNRLIMKTAVDSFLTSLRSGK